MFTYEHTFCCLGVVLCVSSAVRSPQTCAKMAKCFDVKHHHDQQIHKLCTGDTLKKFYRMASAAHVETTTSAT